MINKINSYIFFQIIKSCLLVFFIFLSISWLLQLTRLFTLTNLIQVDIFSIIFLSLYIIPNLLTVIIPFVVIFGILLCFLKLYRDKEIIAIYSLGLQLKPFKNSLILFTFILSILYLILNCYIAPKIYEKYKYKEFELRNTINFSNIVSSNFLELNEDTTLDFKRNNNLFEDIFISFNDKYENIIFAEKGIIKNEKNIFNFQLSNGFKLSIKDNEIEKLEFENYLLKIDDENNSKFDNFDRNSFTIFDDFKNNDYLNISFKIFDILFSILIIFFFYINNIVKIDFSIQNNLLFISYSIIILIVNQIIKNAEIEFIIYTTYSIAIILVTLSILILKQNYEKS
tara:strand:+ start:533 stop:1555 length:1023 start_codon:yes stop_codon:yes gene_type:complete